MDKFYIDDLLQFGLLSALKLMNTIADGLESVTSYQGVEFYFSSKCIT